MRRSPYPLPLAVLSVLIVMASFLPASAQLIPRWEVLLDSSLNSSALWPYLAHADTRHFVGVELLSDRWRIARTTNTGESWEVVLSDKKNDSVAVRGVAHPSRDLIIVPADSTFNRGLSGLQIVYDYTTFILRSSDGGASWSRIPVGDRFRSRQSRGVKMSSAQTGYLLQWASGDETTDMLWRTTDGGLTWSSHPLPSGFIGTLDWSVVSDTVLVLRSGSTIVRSTDGGAEWESFPSALPPSPFSLSFPASQIGYAAGSHKAGTGDQFAGVVYKTIDGGHSWQMILDTTTNMNGFSSIYFRDADDGFATGGAGVFRTTDGGGSWQKQEIPTTGIYQIYLRALAIADRDTILAIGNPASVLRFTGEMTLAAPAVLAPAANGIVHGPSAELQWSRIEGASSYHLQIIERDAPEFPAPVPDFSSGLFLDAGSLSDTSHVIDDLKHGKEYVIRVRASAGSYQSSWSLPRYIRPEYLISVKQMRYEHGGASSRSHVVRQGERMEIDLGKKWTGQRFTIVNLRGEAVFHGKADEAGMVLVETKGMAPGLCFLLPVASGDAPHRILMLP